MQFCIEINMLYLFQSLSGTTDSSIIEATLAQMRDDGLKPDLHTFNFVIYGYVLHISDVSDVSSCQDVRKCPYLCRRYVPGDMYLLSPGYLPTHVS